MEFSKEMASGFLEQEGYKSINIDNKKYTIKLLPAYHAFIVGMQLIKAFLPALGGFLDGSGKEEYQLPEESSLFAETALLLVGQLDKVDLVEVVQHLLKGMYVDGVEVDPNAHFTGKVGNMVKLLEFALKENFSDFFTGYLKEKGLGIHSLKSKMPLQQDTSTG